MRLEDLLSAWPDVRLLGVLPRIALAYTATGLLCCFFKPRALAAALVKAIGTDRHEVTAVGVGALQIGQPFERFQSGVGHGVVRHSVSAHK